MHSTINRGETGKQEKDDVNRGLSQAVRTIAVVEGIIVASHLAGPVRSPVGSVFLFEVFSRLFSTVRRM